MLHSETSCCSVNPLTDCLGDFVSVSAQLCWGQCGLLRCWLECILYCTVHAPCTVYGTLRQRDPCQPDHP